ncbi:MAG: hypothetical protein Q4F79_05600 [Eubacteriales bacterium]|nr:hypothetical protein [Eubacteriales bacterium]
MPTDYDITAAFEAIENELISSMMRNMKSHRAEETDEGYAWSQWQAEQLQSLEEYKRHGRTKFHAQFQSINKDMETLLREVKQQGGMEQEETILRAIQQGATLRPQGNMDASFFRANERKLDALIKATTDDMQKAETAVLRRANDQYRKIIFNAQVYANTGAGTYEKAVDMATKDFLSGGIQCVVYANGARHTLADYAEMAIRTASKRAYLQGEGEKRQEWGIPTVILNKRGNACPKCAPFCGKVFIDDVWSGGSSNDKSYPLLSSAIAKGLYHPRCKDSHTTYFHGITEESEPWTKEEREKLAQDYSREQKQQHAQRQVKKYRRLATHSLDEDNQRTYAARAQDWETVYTDLAIDGADEKTVPIPVANANNSGIINLNRGAKRKETNQGAFASLEIPMQKREVRKIADRYGIDLKGMTVKIQRSEKMLALPTTGMTDYKNIGRIDLLPNAFQSEEQLVRTLIHERCHVLQLKKYGARYAQDNLDLMEKQAYAFEDFWYAVVKKRGGTV